MMFREITLKELLLSDFFVFAVSEESKNFLTSRTEKIFHPMRTLRKRKIFFQEEKVLKKKKYLLNSMFILNKNQYALNKNLK